MPANVIALDTTEAARRWAVALLRRLAEHLESAPDEGVFDVLTRCGGALTQLEHDWRPRPRP